MAFFEFSFYKNKKNANCFNYLLINDLRDFLKERNV